MAARQLPFGILPKTFLTKSHEKRSMRVSPVLIECAAGDAASVYARLKTQATGLTFAEAERRLAEHGQNILAKDRRPSLLSLGLSNSRPHFGTFVRRLKQLRVSSTTAN
jgi:magnesium-transporting ATPase (P-type)